MLYGIKCRAGKTDIEWKVGSGKAPVRLKLHKGIPGFNNDSVLYVTVECFVSAGFEDAPGEYHTLGILGAYSKLGYILLIKV